MTNYKNLRIDFNSYNDYYKNYFNELLDSHNMSNSVDKFYIRSNEELIDDCMNNIFNSYSITSGSVKHLLKNYLISNKQEIDRMLIRKYKLSKYKLIKYYLLSLLLELNRDRKITIESKYISDIQDKIDYFKFLYRSSQDINYTKDEKGNPLFTVEQLVDVLYGKMGFKLLNLTNHELLHLKNFIVNNLKIDMAKSLPARLDNKNNNMLISVPARLNNNNNNLDSLNIPLAQSIKLNKKN